MMVDRARTALLSLSVFLAGCFGGSTSGGDGSPSPTPAPPPPAPQIVYTQEVDCPPTGNPAGTIPKSFEVPDGYDQLIITFHASGAGNVSVRIRNLDSGQAIWTRSLNVQQPPCGSHAHEGGGVNRTVEPGQYESTLSWTGAVGIHYDIVARSSRAPNETASHHL